MIIHKRNLIRKFMFKDQDQEITKPYNIHWNETFDCLFFFFFSYKLIIVQRNVYLRKKS